MPNTTINLNSRPVFHGTPEFRVYTKSQWTDDFQLRDDVLVEELVWNIAPSISTGTLHYRYGTVKDPDSDACVTRLPADSRGWFVLVIVTGDNDDPPLHWLGFAESAVTTEVFPNESGGVQTIPCYGLDRLLQMTPLDTTVFKNPDDEADEEALRRSFAAPINPRKPGNRTANRVVINDDGLESYVFATPDDTDAEWWSTQNLFEYLFRCHLQAGEQGSGEIPWAIAGDISTLPQWDRPTLSSVDQRTIHSIVTDLLGVDRMLGWSVQSVINAQSNFFAEATPLVEQVQIVPFSRLDAALTLPSIGSMPANLDQITWVGDQDAATSIQVQTDDSDTVDQVIVRGPLEIGVGTFQFSVEGQLEKAWSATLSDEYEIANSDQIGWPFLNQYIKGEWNTHFRDQTKYDDVYRLYGFKPQWDGTVDAESLFVEDDGETYVPFLGNMKVLDALPLFSGIDYEGDATTVDEDQGRRMLPILAFIERPDEAATFTAVQNAHSVYGTPPIRLPNMLPYLVSVKADNQKEPAFEIEVSGAPRHALDPTGFIPNDGDPEFINPKIWGEYDYRTLLVTAALRGDRRPEYRIPDQVTGDLVRQRIITLEHSGLELVHIATGTVVGLDKDGGKLTSDGGLLRNPLPELEALARIAEKSLIQPRKTVQIRTGRMVGGINVGNLIKTIDGETVNAVIRQIRIHAPVVEDADAPPTIMSIDATTNEIDLVSLVGRVPQPEAL